ncbi:MAG: glycosyltransferase family A protein [Candidatus Doudnabacteria bacterium]|nr:glycosyltransferase family A protein [bacterium]MDZ4244262.1 glycosyltransferase family A protein [Candidatus Doudnabacteria bacterium]
MFEQKLNISCIIPTCDRSEYLREALDSVLKQTYEPYEIIVINNGKDKVHLSSELADKVQVYDIIPYAGVAQARNFGASMATGHYLAFLDDDCQWGEKYLENIVPVLFKGIDCVLSGQYVVENGKFKPLRIPVGQLRQEVLLVQNPGAGGPNVVISKDLFFRVRGYDPKLPPSEDKAMILEVLRTGTEVSLLPENKVIIGVNEGQTLSTNYTKFIEGVFQFTRKYRFLMNREQYFFNRWKIAKSRLAKLFWAVQYRVARFLRV